MLSKMMLLRLSCKTSQGPWGQIKCQKLDKCTCMSSKNGVIVFILPKFSGTLSTKDWTLEIR